MSGIEEGFRVYRAESASGPFAAVRDLLADTVSWVDDENSPGGPVVQDP